MSAGSCNPDAIPDECLQGDVLVKANHGCDFNYRVRGGRWDRSVLREKGQRWLTSVYGKLTGEWGYSQVEPKLFVEEAVGDEDAGLIEFQVRASNGTAMLGSVMGHCKTPAQWFAYLDPDGNQTLGMNDPDGSPIVPSPRALAAIEPYLRAVEYTRRLSVGVDYARFDFMWNGRDLLAGSHGVSGGRSHGSREFPSPGRDAGRLGFAASAFPENDAYRLGPALCGCAQTAVEITPPAIARQRRCEFSRW